MEIRERIGSGVRFAFQRLPQPLRNMAQVINVGYVQRTYGRLPLKETFERIYDNHLWGRGTFNSGSGSAEAVTRPYVQLVSEFIRAHGVSSIVDLGCGDFRVGRQLVRPGLRYTGVDIVESLVDRNTREFGSNEVAFEWRNLVEEAPPAADLGLLRQVLQHLDNAEISRVLANCRGRFRHLLVTEHISCGPAVRYNIDKPHGPDVRSYKGSGVFLEYPPFELPVKVLQELPIRRVSARNESEVLRTVRLEL